MPLQVRSFRHAVLPLALALALPLLLPSNTSAQYFGRNKVQWEHFDWRTLKTDHFDIYYYPEEEQAVRETARLAERWYTRLSGVFERRLLERKPIILYADQSDFQQTTAVGGLIGQGTGGVTESLKTRVILPLTGNWKDTDHVLGHELVHVFQYDVLFDPARRRGQQGAPPDMPLWFVEGLAEYLSLGRESSLTSMWLRDAVSRDTLPDIRRLGRDPRLFPYRWGHALWAYIGGRFGDVATTRIFARAVQIGVAPAIEEVLNLKVADLSKDWQASIRRDYGPVVEGRQAPAALGARIVPLKADADETDVGPVISPNGQDVIFFSTRNLFTFDLYLADARTGEIRGRLVSENGDAHFDALRFLDSAGAWSPDGRKFVFVVFAKGDSELEILDVASKKIERRIPVANVGAIWNPTWSPDGRSIAFSGAAGGITDLYLYDLESGATRKLTNDPFSDLQPDFSPDGRTIAFVSDRGAGAGLANLTGPTPSGIWLLDVSTGAGGHLRPVASDFGGNQVNPRFGSGGHDLFFLSDRDGVNDIYRVALDGSNSGESSGQVFRVTRSATGVTGITQLSPALTVAPSSGRLMFSVFTNSDYQIHSLEPAQTRGEPVEPGPAHPGQTTAALLPPIEQPVPSQVGQYLANSAGLGPEPSGEDYYRPRLALDWVGPSAGVGVSSLGYSFAGNIAAIFSDMLGQREVGFAIQGGTGTLDQLGGQGYYLNQSHHLQWGVEGGHVPYISAFATAQGVDVDQGNGNVTRGTLYQEVQQTVTIDQASFITRYPFSATRRFELNAGVTRLGYDNKVIETLVVGNQIIDENDHHLPAPPSLQLYQASAAFVGDTSYFGFTSPVSGRRYHLELESTAGDLTFQSLIGDYRRYFFLRPVTLAARGLYVGRFGRDAESSQLSPLYVGDPTLVRGYEVGDISASECTPVPSDPNACPEFDRLVGSRVAVANLELRMPLFGTRGYGLIELPWLPTELSAFVDAGAAWAKGETFGARFDKNTPDRVPVVSTGLSARVLLGGIAVFELYYAKPFQRPEAGYVTGFLISPGW
jgi:Tol biopolymer transport system component